MSLSPNGPNSESPVENSLPNVSPAVNGSPGPSQDREFVKEMRGSIMIVAILAAGSTFQAALNPPGGVWQTDDKKHGFVAGMPVLKDKFSNLYLGFYLCNTISFISSLFIIVFLMNEDFYCNRIKIYALRSTMVLDLSCFILAYSAGSCPSSYRRMVISFIYVFILTDFVWGVILVACVYHPSLAKRIAEILSCTRPCMQNTDQHPRQDHIVPV